MFDKRYIIALLAIRGIGIVKARAVLEKGKGMPSETANDLFEAIMAHANLRKNCPTLADCKKALEDADRRIETLEEQDIKIVVYRDEEFPDALLDARDDSGNAQVPIVLYCKGDTALLKRPALAVIGTRHPSPEGATAAFMCGKFFAEDDFNIVGGLALGCDTEAHKGALNVGGKTTAFLAHGLDTVYPPQNEALAKGIVDSGGLLVSEYEPGQEVAPHNLIARERLQAALASAAIVIQTGIEDEAMRTATLVAAMNKPLYCIKYKEKFDIPLDKISGNDYLSRKKKAKFVTSADIRQKVKEDLGLLDLKQED